VRPVDPRLLRVSPAARRYLSATVAVGVLVTGLVLAQAWLLAVLLTRAIGGASLGELRTPVLLLLGVVLGRAALAWLQEEAAFRSAARLTSDLRAAVLGRLVQPRAARAADGPGRGPGAMVTLLTSGVDALDGYVAKFLPQLVLAVVVPVAVVTQLALLDPLSALLVGLTLPLVPVFMILVGLHTRASADRQWRRLSVLSGHFLDVVQGLPTLKVFGRAKAQAETVRRVSTEHREATARVLRVAFLSALVLELVATLSVAVVAVGVGLRLLDGGLDLRTALVVLVLAPEAYLPVRAVGASFHASAEGLSAAGDALDVLAEPVAPTGSAPAPDARSHGVALHGVTVRLDPAAPPVLDGLDLRLAAGRTTAVMAPSGAGKTTLLALLTGFLAPDAGTVLVADTDLADVDPAAWRDGLAWLPQRPTLEPGTVADNVRLGEPAAGDDEVADALRTVALDPLDLAAGLATVVGEQGAGLSAGQRQRVALARLVLRTRRRDCRLVLLDEPTAHLDAGTEAVVAAALRAELAGRTVLVATHRPAPAAAADVVVGLSGLRPVAAVTR
jgi:thiol reductant ABC exporter CydD subunit